MSKRHVVWECFRVLQKKFGDGPSVVASKWNMGPKMNPIFCSVTLVCLSLRKLSTPHDRVCQLSEKEETEKCFASRRTKGGCSSLGTSPHGTSTHTTLHPANTQHAGRFAATQRKQDFMMLEGRWAESLNDHTILYPRISELSTRFATSSRRY